MKTYSNEDGELHRVNGPAIDWGNGDYSWFYEGQYHRYYGVSRRWGGVNYEYWIFDESIE